MTTSFRSFDSRRRSRPAIVESKEHRLQGVTPREGAMLQCSPVTCCYHLRVMNHWQARTPQVTH